MSGQNYSVILAARSQIVTSVRVVGGYASLIELRGTRNDAEAPCNRQEAKTCDRGNQKQPEVVGGPWSGIGHVRRGKHGGLGICGIVVDHDWAARPVKSYPLMHLFHVPTPT
jgi:hypothetical protein